MCLNYLGLVKMYPHGCSEILLIEKIHQHTNPIVGSISINHSFVTLSACETMTKVLMSACILIALANVLVWIWCV